jgi:methylase of polypeptide subunit release factors
MLDHERIHALLTQPEAPLIIVANLPYIPEQLFKDNVDDRVKKREPKMAFVAGDDGLDLYHVMFAQLQSPLAPLTLFLEMMTRQVDILRQAYPERIFEEVKTFHFNIRIVRVCRV